MGGVKLEMRIDGGGGVGWGWGGGGGGCFFFNDTATTEIYTLSLHDALPIWALPQREPGSTKSGALPQREMGSIKSGGAAATRNGQYKKPGRCRNEK